MATQAKASVYTIVLEGSKLQSADDFFTELGSATQLHHQNNLDALDEDLQYEIPLHCGPYRIIWKDAGNSDWSGYSRLTAVLGTLAYQQQRHPERFVDLILEFEPEADEDTWTYPEMYNAPYYRAEREKRGRGPT